MKIKVWIVTTCIPGETSPCWPDAFGTEAEAERCADEQIRREWEINGPEDDDGERAPYPGDWRAAQETIISSRIEDHGGERWGEWQITSHEIEVVGAAGPSSPEYLDRFPPEARESADRAYQDGYEDGAQSERDDRAAQVAAEAAGWRMEGERFVARTEPDAGCTSEATSWTELCEREGIEVAS